MWMARSHQGCNLAPGSRSDRMFAELESLPMHSLSTMKSLATAVIACLLLGLAPMGVANANTFSTLIPAGKWNLAYQRTGEFKPLFYKHNETGNSSTCIKDNPRQQILDWVSRKGCRVDKEVLLADRYRLSGECRLKWWRSHPIPVDVDLIFGDGQSFVMDIRTRNDPVLSFQEHTLATLLGECPPK